MEFLTRFHDFLSVPAQASKTTTKNYTADVAQFIRWFEEKHGEKFDPNEINAVVLANFKDEFGQKLSQSSLDRHISSLRKFFHYLKIEGLSSHDPFADAKLASAQAQEQEDPFRLRDFKNNLYVYNASRLTIKNYLIDIKQFLTWAETVTGTQEAWNEADKNVFTHIDSRLIEEYKKRLLNEGKFSPASINRKLSSLRKYFTWAQEEGLIQKFEPNFAQVEIKKAEEVEPSLPINEAVMPQAKGYSSFPPIRLFQKITAPLASVFDLIFISPFVFAFDKAEHALWSLKGKPVFKGKKKGFNLPFSSTQAKVPLTAVKNLKKEFYAPALVSIKYLPVHKKMWFHAKNTRPNWYRKYHSYPLTTYFHVAILIIFMSAVGFGFYNAFFGQANKQKSTFATGPAAPPRILSFQGRLTDNSDNPITAVTNLRMAIYDTSAATGSSLLWQEIETVAPDSDGIFSILLGNNVTIPSTLFSENPSLYLGVTVATTPELTPRQRLATVAFASNSETLQGQYPLTVDNTTLPNKVLNLDSSGNLTFAGSTTPVFQATGGQFTISGSTLLLTTTAGSNTNVVVKPDGIGKIDLSKPIQNTTLNNNIPQWAGAVEVDDNFAILATSSGVAAFSINQNSTGDLINASTSGVTKFRVDSSGNITANNLAIGTVTSGTWNGTAIGAQYGGTGINTSSSTGVPYISSGTWSVDSNYLSTLHGGTGATFSTGGGTATGGVFYFNGTTFAATAAGGSTQCLLGGAGTPAWGSCATGNNFWTNLNGTLYPTDLSEDLLVGGNSTASASFHVYGANSLSQGTKPVATISANTSFAALVVDNRGTGDLFTASSSGLNRFVITQGGNVGIGTTVPAAGYLLDAKRSYAGGNTVLSVANTDNTDSASNSWLRAAAGGASGGDPALELTISGVVDWSVGLDNSDSDKFKIGPSSTVGTSTAFTIDSSGKVGIGTSTLLSTLDVRGTSGTISVASVSGATSFAALVANNDGVGDLFTASASSQSKFTITRNGGIKLGLSEGTATNCLLSGGAGAAASWNTCPGGADAYWTSTLGALYPLNSTTDFFIGGQATGSAKFAVLNMNSGTPTASVSSGISGNAAYLTSTGILATARKQSLTLGDTNTGDITVGTNLNFLAGQGTGKIGLGGAVSSSDYLTNITADSTQDWSKALNISQANNAAEDSSVISLSSTAQPPTLSGTSRIITGLDSNVNPAGSISVTNVGSLTLYGINNTVNDSNKVSFGTNGAVGNFANVYGLSNNITASPVYLTTATAGDQYNSYGQNVSISGTPALVNVPTGSIYNNTGDYITVAVNSAGNANLSANSYGINAAISGDLTTTGTTSHTGGYFTISGTADNNYGLYVDSVGSATNNYGQYINSVTGGTAAYGQYINSVGSATSNYGLYINTVAAGANNYGIYDNSAAQNYFAGSVGIGNTAPVGLLDVNGAIKGKALAIFNETGDQSPLTASESGNPVFTIAHPTGSIVNGFTLTPSITNTFVGFTASGSDTNISLAIDPKGSGGLNLGTVSTGVLSIGNTTGTFTLKGSGLTANTNSVLYEGASNVLGVATTGTPSLCLVSGATTPSWSSCGGANYWADVNGTIYPVDLTNDLLIGGNSTASAEFHVYGANPGFQGTLPVASISANTSFAAMVINQNGNGDLFTASSAGKPLFTVNAAGNLLFNGGAPTIDTAAALALNIGTSTQNALTLGRSGATTTINGSSLTIGPTSWTATPTISGLVTASSGLRVSNTLTANSSGVQVDRGNITLSNGANNNIALPANVSYVTATGPTGAYNVSGFANAADGRILVVYFNIAQTLTILHDSANSSAGQRITLPNGDITLAANKPTRAVFIYDQSVGAGVGYWVLYSIIDGVNNGNLNTPGFGGTGTATTFTQGSVVFAGASGIYSQDNSNFFFDDTNNRFGLGVNSSTLLSTLDARGTSGTISVASASGTTSFATLIANQNGVGDIFSASASGKPLFTVLNSGSLSLGGTNPTISATGSNTLTLNSAGTGNIQFFSGSNTITSGGALSIAGNFTQAGTTLQMTNGGTITGNSNALAVNAGGSSVLTLNSGGTGDVIFFGPTACGGGLCAKITSGGDIQGKTFSDADNTAFFLDPAAGTTSLYVAGGAGLGFAGGGSRLATLDVRAINATTPTASFSATSNSIATLVVNNNGTGDLITASSSSITNFLVRQNGSVSSDAYFSGLRGNTNIRATGATQGAGNNSSIYFQNSGGNTAGRVDTVTTPGTGSDGALIVSSGGTVIINGVKTAMGGIINNAGANYVPAVSTTGFSVGDEILLAQTTGTGVGAYEYNEVTSVDNVNNRLVLRTALANTYTSGAQIVRVPQYTTVNVSSGTLSAPAYDGSSGGILVFRASGDVTVGASGTISMTGLGGAGGTGNGGAGGIGNQNGTAGSAGTNGTGPGAGIGGAVGGAGGNLATGGSGGAGGGGGTGGGGGGGGYAAAGTNGSNGASAVGGNGGNGNGGGTHGNGGAGAAGVHGNGGANAGAANFGSPNSGGNLVIGSGGGAGAGGAGGGGANSALGNTTQGGVGGNSTGGNGGGIILINAKTITNSGTIASNGTAGAAGNGSGGTQGTTVGGGGGGSASAAGGGGSGGTIWLNSDTITIGTTNAVGGAAGSVTGTSGGKGGNGTGNSGGGGGGAGATGGAVGVGVNGGSNGIAGTSASGANGGAGANGRIKCDITAGNCSGGSPAVGSNGVYSVNNRTTNYGLLYIGGVVTSEADLAENYLVQDDSIAAGDLVTLPPSDTSSYGLKKPDTPYDKDIFGVISTSPGLVLGGVDEATDSSRLLPVALAGRVPVMVSTESGKIRPGDYLTSSSMPGVAMKATHAGMVVGKALDAFDGSTCIESSDTNPYCRGRIKVFVKVGYYDPYPIQTAMTNVENIGQYAIARLDDGTFGVRDQFGNLINSAQALASAVVGNFTAGIVRTTDLFATNTTTSNLTTDVISPLTQNLVVKLASPSGKFVIQNASGSAVASIDNQGNATFSGTLSAKDATISGSLAASDASISGTLHAGTIIADNILGIDKYIGTQSSIINNNYYFASPSGSASGSGNLADLGFDGNYYFASLSAELANFNNINGVTATFTQGLMAFGPSSLYDLSVTDQLSVGAQLTISDRSVNVLGNDLQIQPLRQGGVDFLAGLVKIDVDGNLTVNGNATFAKDVSISGTLSANILSSFSGHDLTLRLGSDGSSNSALQNISVKNASNSSVFTITSVGDFIASGAGTFDKLNLSVVPKALALSDTEVIATGSAGVATISAHQTEITVDNSLVTDKSLIYITPKADVSGVGGLYLMRQVDGTSFTVGINSQSTVKIPFNWIIVN